MTLNSPISASIGLTFTHHPRSSDVGNYVISKFTTASRVQVRSRCVRYGEEDKLKAHARNIAALGEEATI